MSISKEGIPALLGLLFFNVALGWLGYHYGNPAMIGVFYLFVLLFVFCLYFFRDPKRLPPKDPNVIVSPADGKVVEIKTVNESLYLKQEVTRVAIFLSVFDVHVNYVPLGGQVDYVKFKRGTFLPAYKSEASESNQFTLVGMITPFGKMAFKQSAGLVARRIVCHLRYGQEVPTGYKFGIIKFGSRAEVYLPKGATLLIKEGDRLRAGESVIAHGDEKQ
jgi:phosphatidylserine decarboxylase